MTRTFGAATNERLYVTVDGTPLLWLSRLLRRPVGARVTGADLLPALGLTCREFDRTLVIIGGPSGVSDQAVQRLVATVPGLRAYSVPAPGPGFEVGGDADREMVRNIKSLGADMVIVCFGAPRQELWMEHHRLGMPGVTLVGAGAAVDFLAGTKRRAPAWMQRAGAEWLHRLLHDFRRLRHRYLVRDPRFMFLAAGEMRRELLGRPSSSRRPRDAALVLRRENREGELRSRLTPARGPVEMASIGKVDREVAS